MRVRHPRRALIGALALIAALLPVLGAGPAAAGEDDAPAADVNAASPPDEGASAAAYPGNRVELAGHGWGHGRGLGQYGSLGYAIDHGWNYEQILDHFYGGTTMGSRANDPIDVRIVAQDTADLHVTAGVVFVIGSNTFQPGEAARVHRLGDGTWEISRANDGCGATDWRVAQVVSGDIQPEAVPFVGDQGDDINKMLWLCRPGAVRHYRGTLRTLVGDGVVRTVNRLPMEQYLKGVVPRESPASWADLGGGKGAHALRAQAVAARSYAFGESRASWAKTCDTTSCQVYGGAGLNGALIEDARANAAIAATAGQVRVSGNNAVARTEFSSSTGGWTAGGTFPSVEDLGDDVAQNPNHNWTATVLTSAIESKYPQIGSLFSVDIARRNGRGADGGRALNIVLRGDRGSVTVTGDQFRSAFALKSDWVRVTTPVLDQNAVGIAANPAGDGFWLVASDGTVIPSGDAAFYGSMAGQPLNKPIVGMAPTPTGRGYWLVATDGGIFSFGDAVFYGSTGSIRLNQPIVGMTSTRTGRGYWFVASDGGIFAFGDARFHGSMGGTPLNQPVVGMSATRTGGGYWLVARDGGIFSFGDARFLGSTGSIRLAQPIVGMTVNPVGDGYWFVAADGGIFAFGNAPFYGSTGGQPLTAPITGMAATRTGAGYRLAGRDAAVYPFGNTG